MSRLDRTWSVIQSLLSKLEFMWVTPSGRLHVDLRPLHVVILSPSHIYVCWASAKRPKQRCADIRNPHLAHLVIEKLRGVAQGVSDSVLDPLTDRIVRTQ